MHLKGTYVIQETPSRDTSDTYNTRWFFFFFFFYPAAITTLNKLRIWCYIKDMMHKSITVHLEYRNANEVEKVGNMILDGYSPIRERWMVETLKDSLTGWRTAAIAWQQGMGAFIYSNITSFHDSFHQAGQRPGEDMAIYQPPRLSSHMYWGRLCRQRLTEQCMEPDSPRVQAPLSKAPLSRVEIKIF